jgi:integrase
MQKALDTPEKPKRGRKPANAKGKRESVKGFTQAVVSGLRIPKKSDKPNRYRKITRITPGLGLVLLVSYSGTKTWQVLFYENGKPRTKALGRFPEVGVKAAYDKARKFDTEKAIKKVKAGTFRKVAEDFITNYVEVEGLRSQPEIVRCLERYVYPEWGTRKFLEIGRSDVAKLRDTIREERGKRQANMVLAILSKLFNWYGINRSDTYVSPIVRGMKYKTTARERVLSDDELRAVWDACEGTFGDIVKLLLLTAQRREKVGTMKWDDLSDIPFWNITRAPREKSNPGVLKLPQMALDIIEARDEVAGNSYVFPGRVTGHAFNSYSQAKAHLDAKLPKNIPNWTLHDLRRTARSLMARAGVSSHIAERTLGHTIKGVEGVYDRHAYENEKAHALEALAKLVESIVNPPKGDNVVPMVKSRARRQVQSA